MNEPPKRIFDVICSGVGIILLAPLMAGLALWIRIDSPGPVFFLQRRVGKECCRFRIVKFRTMLHRDPDSIDQHSEAIVSEGDDPRITQAGRFLRKTSLDELPQLWNILRGDMSVVGPRPLLPEQLEVVPADCMKRFDVRPGLTGLAQVRGRRGLGWLEQVQADAEYVRDRGFLYDMWLILSTIRIIATAEGIYGDKVQNWRAYRDESRGKRVARRSESD